MNEKEDREKMKKNGAQAWARLKRNARSFLILTVIQFQPAMAKSPSHSAKQCEKWERQSLLRVERRLNWCGVCVFVGCAYTLYQSSNITYNIIIVCWMSQSGIVNAVKRFNGFFLRLKCFEQQMKFLHNSHIHFVGRIECVLCSCYEQNSYLMRALFIWFICVHIVAWGTLLAV